MRYNRVATGILYASHGMNMLAVEIEYPYALDVHVTEDALSVDMNDWLAYHIFL
jgi:hypothetical protein